MRSSHRAIAGYWQSRHRLKTTAGYSGSANIRFENLMISTSPFHAMRLATPGYANQPGGDYVDMNFNVDFDDYVWLYLHAHKIDYVVLHRWAVPLNPFSFPLKLDLLETRLRPARIFEDRDTIVYDASRLARPKRPVVLCTDGWARA